MSLSSTPVYHHHYFFFDTEKVSQMYGQVIQLLLMEGRKSRYCEKYLIFSMAGGDPQKSYVLKMSVGSEFELD